MTISHAYFNGKPATIDDLTPLAFAGYAHFTAMQVRNRAVRGLDLHLDRLRSASEDLFGCHLPDEQVRGLLSSAVRSTLPDVSLTCFLSPRPENSVRTSETADIDVLVKVTDPATPPAGPLSLAVFPHERHLPHVKHVGEVAKGEFLRRARTRGFEDAVFTDASGFLSEATIWNIAFWDGRHVIWPRGDVLPGITMQILKRRLAAHNVDQITNPIRISGLKEETAAVVLNSWSPGIPVARIAKQALGDAGDLVSILHKAYASEPPVAL